MPYFKWQGIDIVGGIKSGKSFSKTVSSLDAALEKRGIALLKAQESYVYWLSRTISLQDRADFFKQLALLVDAGILLPQALSLVAEHVASIRLQYVAHAIADQVHDGTSFCAAIAQYKEIFGSLAVAQLSVAQESGKLGQGLLLLSDALDRDQAMRRAIRSALVVPLITFSFFILVVIFLFAYIVPRFADIFSASQEQLPFSTRIVLAISSFMRSSSIVPVIGIGALFMIAIYYLVHTAKGKYLLDRLVLSLPFIGAIITYRCNSLFFDMVGMLVQAGVALVPALEIVAHTVSNTVFNGVLCRTEQAVRQGESLSYALSNEQKVLFDDRSIAMIRVGEESGTLGAMLEKVGSTYRELVQQRLAICMLLLQPVLMAALGVLVTALIFAVYEPVFNSASIPSL